MFFSPVENLLPIPPPHLYNEPSLQASTVETVVDGTTTIVTSQVVQDYSKRNPLLCFILVVFVIMAAIVIAIAYFYFTTKGA